MVFYLTPIKKSKISASLVNSIDKYLESNDFGEDDELYYDKFLKKFYSDEFIAITQNNLHEIKLGEVYYGFAPNWAEPSEPLEEYIFYMDAYKNLVISSKDSNGKKYSYYPWLNDDKEIVVMSGGYKILVRAVREKGDKGLNYPVVLRNNEIYKNKKSKKGWFSYF